MTSTLPQLATAMTSYLLLKPVDGTYFSLKEGLERLLGRAVDLVSITSIRNPYFRDQVMRTREPLYAA